MPSVGDIIDYGEQKYFQLVYLFCSTSSDYKAQLDSVGIDWQKISDFEMFRQLFIGNKNQDMSILLGDMDTSGFMMAKDNISGEIVLHNRLTDTRIDHVVYGCRLLQARLVIGVSTKTKLMEWQKAHGLIADGICGPATWGSF